MIYKDYFDMEYITQKQKKSLQQHMFAEGSKPPFINISSQYWLPTHFQSFLTPPPQKNCVLLGKRVDSKQDYQKNVDVFVGRKDVQFEKSYNFPGNANFESFCLTCLTLNLIAHIKTTWFAIFSAKHPVCKTSLRLNRWLIKVKTKTLQVCLSEFCNHSQLLFIVLYFQVINVNP